MFLRRSQGLRYRVMVTVCVTLKSIATKPGRTHDRHPQKRRSRPNPLPSRRAIRSLAQVGMSVDNTLGLTYALARLFLRGGFGRQRGVIGWCLARYSSR